MAEPGGPPKRTKVSQQDRTEETGVLLMRYFVMTEEFNRVGSYHPPEYGRDVVEVEAKTKREARVLGLRALRKMRSTPVMDAESDNRNPLGTLTVERYDGRD